ncbi:MAG TPA: DUF4188 domain-containing protein [Ktedonobacteraceae bacterium]|jgi:hypothetical protein|nr:DUF4188 domain-containing protein [Ktedonobacteraceae bacterium]
MAKFMPIRGRFTAQTDEPFVVFMAGVRINRFWAFRKWIPAVMAIIPMMRTLYKHRALGYLGGQPFIYWPGIGAIQYWKSFEDLEHFARSKEDPHLEAWRRFNKSVGTDGSVGIWHETYLIHPRDYEVIYNNMPIFGLATATTTTRYVKHVPAIGRQETARRRLGEENEPAVPSPANPT